MPALRRRALWGWASPIWMAGGIAAVSTSFFIESSWPSSMPSRFAAELCNGICEPGFSIFRRYLAFHIGRYHYDLGNDLFQSMLGKRMIYTSGYWKQREVSKRPRRPTKACRRQVAVAARHEGSGRWLRLGRNGQVLCRTLQSSGYRAHGVQGTIPSRPRSLSRSAGGSPLSRLSQRQGRMHRLFCRWECLSTSARRTTAAICALSATT